MKTLQTIHMYGLWWLTTREAIVCLLKEEARRDIHNVPSVSRSIIDSLVNAGMGRAPLHG